MGGDLFATFWTLEIKFFRSNLGFSFFHNLFFNIFKIEICFDFDTHLISPFFRTWRCNACKYIIDGRLWEINNKNSTSATGNPDNQTRIHIREVINMEPDMEKIIRLLLDILGEQEGVKIEYTLEKTA